MYEELIKAIYMIHRENMAIMKMLSYENEWHKVQKWDEEFLAIFEKKSES